MLAEAKWDKIKGFSGGIAIAELAGKQYLISPNGNLAYPEALDKILRLKEGYYLVESNGKAGLLNSLGNPILPISFDQILVENKDFFIVSKVGLSGIIRANGDVFLPLQYTQVEIDWNEQKVLVKGIEQAVVTPEPIPEKTPQGKRKKGA